MRTDIGKCTEQLMALDHEKKGGPYTKNEKRKRLDEVYRLYFEYGYSARNIAEFLNINRNTINRDVMYWYTSINKNWEHLDPTIFVANQVERLELQRTRLRKQLDKVELFQEKIIIEKLILDIDTKIANFKIRLVEAESSTYKKVGEQINKWFEKVGSGNRVIF
ncbi:MAG: hypothetical protein HYZ55_01405, partial [Nitrosarchaeum sp.]|nr:hypothetical protein [Nitrosarchaeum sp.]